MKLSPFLAAAILPFSVLAIPAAPLDANVVEKREPGVLSEPLEAFLPTKVVRTPDKVMLPRANTSQAVASLSDLLGDLIPSLKAVISLLNSETINNIKTTIDGLATVLGNGRAAKTGNLLDDVGGLLNDDLINSLKEVLPSVSGLLTKQNVDSIESLLKNANSLLTEQFVKQTVGLINDVAPLVSAISQIITTLIQAVLGG